MKLAIISDIHEDVVNLKLALHKINRLNCDEILCLGDISGFSVPHYDFFETRNAQECLRLIRENCNIIIAGNHDLHAARITPKISPEFIYPENWYQWDYPKRQHISRNRVWLYENDELNALYSHADIEFIKTLPEFHIFKTPSQNILFSHFIYPNLTGSSREFYIYKEDFEAHLNFMKDKNCALSFSGHRHFGGLIIVSKHITEEGFHSKYTLEKGDRVLVPAIARKKTGAGFCMLDTENQTIEAIRI